MHMLYFTRSLSYLLIKFLMVLSAVFLVITLLLEASSSVSSNSDSRGWVEPQHVECSRMIEIQIRTFEQLLSESVGRSNLAPDLDKAKMSSSDLVEIVRISDLERKYQLGDALFAYSENLRETARELQRLSVEISESVDNLLAISDRTLQIISNKHSYMKIIWPFTSNKFNKDHIATTFNQFIYVLSASLERLILSIDGSLAPLNNLEVQLNTICEIVSEEGSSLSVANAELLAAPALWNRVEGNRAMVLRLANNLHLFKELGIYRAQAFDRVVAARQELQDLSANINALRERASFPEVAESDLFVAEHVRLLQKGIERLKKEADEVVYA